MQYPIQTTVGGAVGYQDPRAQANKPAERPTPQLEAATSRAERVGSSLALAEEKLERMLVNLRGAIPAAVSSTGENGALSTPPAMRRLDLAVDHADQVGQRIHNLLDELSAFIG